LSLGLSLARIVQGAHFVSDTLWSFGTMMLISGILYYFVLRIPSQETVSTLGRFFKHRYQ
jgi:membrane-associated PAP2 superfamily phosphatase